MKFEREDPAERRLTAAALAIGAGLVLVGCRAGGAASSEAEHSGVREAPRRPHIVVVLADDLGYADLGFTGCRDIPTPHLDQLARGGVVCRDAHVSASVCAPSRAGLLTGRYQQRTGFECNLGGGDGLLAGTATFPAALQRAGYETHLIGKWHLGGEPHNHPSALGFEHFTGLIGGSRSYFPLLEREGGKAPGRARRIERDGAVVPESSLRYMTDFFTDEGVRAIESRDPARPLLLVLSYTAPHGPMHARADLLERFAGIEDPRRAKYAAMVTALDDGVGRIMDALEQARIADNTLTVFLSDNGGATGNASDNGPWRGMKGSKWEGGHRVPFVVHWPSTLPPGVFDAPVSSLDLGSTFVAAAGAEPLPISDGIDLMPVFTGARAPAPERPLHWRRAVAAATRSGRWKLIRIEDEEGAFRDPILVDLVADPGELENRAPEEPGVVAALQRQLAAFEQRLVPPRWLTADLWRQNQRKKHEPGVVGREAERELP